MKVLIYVIYAGRPVIDFTPTSINVKERTWLTFTVRQLVATQEIISRTQGRGATVLCSFGGRTVKTFLTLPQAEVSFTSQNITLALYVAMAEVDDCVLMLGSSLCYDYLAKNASTEIHNT